MYARGQAPNFTAVAGATSANNSLTGTAGNDLIQSGQGNDTMTGAAGADVFRFGFIEVGSDTITDFTRTTGDKLDLRDLFSGTGFTTFTAAQFMQMAQSGNDAVLRFDVDGMGQFTTPELSGTLQGAWADLAPGAGQSVNDKLFVLMNDRVFMV